jgi:hypothetical protein
VGCATAIAPEDPAPTDSTTKKDGGTADAKGASQLPQQDSGTVAPDTGTNDDPQLDGGGACTLMINYGSNNCQTCMQGCCAQDNACVNSQDCVDLINCLNGCSPNDSSCVAGCRGQHQSGASLFDGITSCMGSKCPSSCP